MKLLIIPLILLLGCGKPSKPSSLSGNGTDTTLLYAPITATVDTTDVHTLDTLDSGDIERSRNK